MCHDALGTDGMVLERSPGPVKFVVLESDGMTGEKYIVPLIWLLEPIGMTLGRSTVCHFMKCASGRLHN
jgi:hypothetical protein